MINIGKYIQIPYKSHGRDFDGCDCYGLVWLVFKNEFNKELPLYDNEYDNPRETENVSKIIDAQLPLLCGDKIENPKEGSVALFKYFGKVCHMGIFIEPNRILHILPKTQTVICERLNSPFLRGRLEGYYELR